VCASWKSGLTEHLHAAGRTKQVRTVGYTLLAEAGHGDVPGRGRRHGSNSKVQSSKFSLQHYYHCYEQGPLPKHSLLLLLLLFFWVFLQRPVSPW
jgi:hypothetical protein